MKVAIVGYGAMGTLLVNRIANTPNVTLIGVVDKVNRFGVSNLDDLSVIPDVIIDFSHPSYLQEIITYATDHNCAVLFATTGYNEKDLLLIEEAARHIPIIQTYNTSLGINLLNEVIKDVAKILTSFDIEIIEKHHNKKVDSPSGTAKLLLESVLRYSDKTTPIYGRVGNERRESTEIGVHSVRGGTIPGEHSVLFAGEDEIIELKHTALSKEVFVTGALKAASFLVGRDAGLYSMKDVLL